VIFTEEEYLNERLDKQIQWYDHKSMEAQRYHKALKIIEMVLSASIPILIAFWKKTVSYRLWWRF